MKNKTYLISGIAESRKVFINGVELNPKPGQKIINHSPDGFNWGYGGSGPAQLALSIVLALTGKIAGYQVFKWAVISRQRIDKDFLFEITDEELQNIILDKASFVG